MPLPEEAQAARAKILGHVGEIASATALFEKGVDYILGILIGDTRIVPSLCSGWTVGRKLDKIRDVIKAVPIFQGSHKDIQQFVEDAKLLLRERNSLLHNITLTGLDGTSWSGVWDKKILSEETLESIHADIAKLYVNSIQLAQNMLSGCSSGEKPRCDDFVFK